LIRIVLSLHDVRNTTQLRSIMVQSLELTSDEFERRFDGASRSFFLSSRGQESRNSAVGTIVHF